MNQAKNNSLHPMDIPSILMAVAFIFGVILVGKVFQLTTATEGMRHVIESQQQELQRAEMMRNMDQDERLIFDPRADNWSNLPVNPELDPRYINNR